MLPCPTLADPALPDDYSSDFLQMNDTLLAHPLRDANPRHNLRSLRRRFAFVQLALGKQMYRAGIDDGCSGAGIRKLNREIIERRSTGVAAHELYRQRDRLFRQLADAALENDAPLPGAQDEFEVAFAARADLDG
jgi:hypothetical protein